MVTAYDVAAQAGVSVGTVSRYLTGNGYVSEAARQRIAAAVAELGYIQNRAAASLTTKKTGLLGFVVSQLSNPFTAEVAAALGDEARADGYGVVISDSNGDPDLAIQAITLLRSHDVDGLIVTPPESPAYNDALLAAARSIPVVGIGLRTNPMVTDLVSGDTRGGARLARSHLLALGHSRIAYVGGSNMASGRFEGYRDSLTESGIEINADLISLGTMDREAGFNAVQRFLTQPAPVTAVFAANDALALGVLQGAHRLGVRVPQQLSVIGYDNVDMAVHAIPPLTTVAQNMVGMGRAAIRLLMDRLSGAAPAGEPRQVVLESTLVIRESCAEPAGQ
ncbi:MAG: LacI family DNA-binding transcriptional regulator [Propionicimonas sp.]|nr:LacI family DNA-binding transcriptional regulator [Propionicimonas sp.]